MGKNKNKNGSKDKGGHAKSSGSQVGKPKAGSMFKKDSKKAGPGAAGGGKQSGLSLLQQKFAKKLEGSRFRQLNEQLYTSKGVDAFSSFQATPSLFETYHEGFREQASHWPENPLNTIIAWVRKKHPRAVIADMGCGDARLAMELSPPPNSKGKEGKNKGQSQVPAPNNDKKKADQAQGQVRKTNIVHSFDLVSNNEYVTACDCAHVPLKAGTVDIVVFCLALMGTNIGEFLKEANRLLKPNGILKIAEVRSRFEGEAEGVKKFIRVLKKAGFDIKEGQGGSDGNSLGQRDKSDREDNRMFFEIEGRKSSRPCDPDVSYSIKPCIYKRR